MAHLPKVPVNQLLLVLQNLVELAGTSKNNGKFHQ